MNVERGPLVRQTERKRNVSSGSQLSPIDILSIRLRNELARYQEVSEDLRRNWQEEMKGLPQISSMNTGTLAIALIILYRLGDTFTAEEIRSELDRFVFPESEETNEEKARFDLKKKEEIFRYIRAVNNYRERNRLSA
ncbi:hypothetical protein pv_16 [Pithovirus sibericum]|uniref:Uncharacterized protein n=1 Tax=Pithovirus sibericum TaxID=1450746 RepID=W5S4B1_9VIRU|nr:hypothetical protein pv_16 [Pithovirus sibericum]AHH01583.1 hypothetical protein pv_16 [Pithovirus sibericum]WIL05141.1 hypothetical protein pmam_102 [Pithovirus mammoth]